MMCYGYGRPQTGLTGLFQAVQRYNGNVAFAYNDGNSSRTENVNVDGTISGSYSVLEANGEVRVVHYKAGKNGVQFSGDIGVDDPTQEAARRLNSVLPTSPTNPPGYYKPQVGPTNPPGYYKPQVAPTNSPNYYVPPQQQQPAVPVVPQDNLYYSYGLDDPYLRR